MSIDSDQAHRRAEALFKKKEQQAHEGQQAMAEYQAQIDMTRERPRAYERCDSSRRR